MDKPQPIVPSWEGVTLALGRIEQAQYDLRRELLGNGQKGRVQEIEAKLEEHAEKFEALSKKQWILTGVLVAAGHGVRAGLAKLGII